MSTNREHLLRQISERSASTKIQSLGLALVLLSLFSTPVLKIESLAQLTSVLLPVAALLGVALFAYATFSTGVAIQRLNRIYRSDGKRDFYWAAVTSTVALLTLAGLTVTVSYIGWLRAAV